MPIQDGDIVLVSYTIKDKEGNLIETTNAELARKENKYSEDEYYGPKPIVVEENILVKGFYKALKEMDVGEKKTVEIPPEEAYGPKDPSRIRKYPVRRFVKAGVRPEVGKIVEINNELGIITRVTDRIVEVDFNHPLAGKRLVYEIEVLDKADTLEKKAKFLVARRLKINPDEVNVAIENNEITIELKPAILNIKDVPLYIKVLGAEIKKHIPDTVKLTFKVSIAYEQEKKEESSREKQEEKVEAKAEEASQ
ncbi:MAG: peptidylprolyl isomerase [Desulfurococcales archaeon]|nr:peptidylprolyl isomerase [Desulfurococcales archaeon]